MIPSKQHNKEQQRQQIGGSSNSNGNIVTDKQTNTMLPSSIIVSTPTRRVSDGSIGNNNNNTAFVPSSLFQQPTPTPGVATNITLSEEDQARIKTSLELIEEARDMEQYNYYNHHHQNVVVDGCDHNNDDDDDTDIIITENCNPQGHDFDTDEDATHREFRRLKEEKQNELYKKAISIMESIVGYYHPDVSNTYHLFGWSLHELGGRRTASALVYFLRALRISQRLFGNDHTSTCVILDDIRDIVDEQRTQHDNAVLEQHCNGVFDSWVYQNLAEEAFIVRNDPVLSIQLYREALRMLPTEPSIMTTTKKNDTDTNNDHEMMSTDAHNNNEDDDAITVATIDTGEYNSKDDETTCIAELERATIQLHMGAIIRQHQMHFMTTNESANNNGGAEYDSSFDLYCKALSVLPKWLSEGNPTVRQARRDVSQLAIVTACNDDSRQERGVKNDIQLVLR